MSEALRETARRGVECRVADAYAWSALMARAQDGDRAAYRRLLEAILPYLRALAARQGVPHADIEDAVQDILLTLHAIRHTYDPARPFAPWLLAIARRRIIDRRRRNVRRAAAEIPLAAKHETFVAADASSYAGDARALHRAIDRLPDGQRRAVTLLKLRELSLKEAEAESGMSVAALKVASHRALKALRLLLGKRSGAPS